MKNDDQTTPNEPNQPPPHDPEKIMALCHELADALSRPDYGSAVLRRQAHLLDHLIYSVMNTHYQREQTRSYFSSDLIELVLRIQKQCADTLKAVEAIDYMKSLSSARVLRPLPPPPESGERNEGR